MPRVFTEDELNALIFCPKQIEVPPRREMRTEGKMKRNEMTLRSSNGSEAFRVFLRQSLEFAENFSLGLIYVPIGDPGSFALVRCNGQHGGTASQPHHAYYHTHKCIADDLNDGILEPRRIEQTSAYASYFEALGYFLDMINLENAENFFPGIKQRLLFDDDQTLA